MRAIVVETTGPPEVLKSRVVPDPVPNGKECLVRVRACGVTAHDVVTRSGVLRRGVVLPVICGHEISGVVEAVGPDVHEWRPGDEVVSTQRRRVCGRCKWCRTGRETHCPDQEFLGDVGLNGGYAEFVLVEEDNLALKPRNLPHAQACIVASAVGTELNALRDVARVQVGETVLVTGAGGGLGIHGVQVARACGARVLAVTTSKEKVQVLEGFGAEVVLAQRGRDFSPLILAATDGEGVDVAVDNVGTAVFTDVRRSMARGGRWVLVGQLSNDFVNFNPAQLFLRGIHLMSALSTSREQLQASLSLIERGLVQPVVTDVLPISKIAEAHTRVESGSSAGRIVVTLDQFPPATNSIDVSTMSAPIVSSALQEESRS